VARGPADSHDSNPVPLETAGLALSRGRGPGWSLFWRTFFLLAALLLVSILAWLQTLRASELDPRAVQAAQQIASLVNLSRAALIHSDSIARVSLIKTMTDQEGVRILPREPSDRFEPFQDDALGDRISQELESRLGPGTVVANSVNGEPGLWVGFTIEDDGYWMFTDRSRLNPPVGKTWIIWLVTAAALSLAGAALIARLINRPLKDLSVAATRVREGDFAASELNETVATSEIRDVNIEFNRMSRKLAQIEQDRAIMLAGISHDLRTPLARLRLETELSVSDIDAREHMASDISQVNAIIDKFMDYARPDHIVLAPVALGEVVERCVYALKDRSDMRFNVDLPNDLRVQADEVELSRVVSNLLENAARYGKSADTGVAEVDISAKPRDGWVLLEVRDHGPGVAPHNLDHLTKAFFRGDAARTSATGAGLGLAIVEKNIQRMGGAFALVNRSSGGLAARIQLQRVT
jgi:two-component system osmolarity sensor histidine kinase EnvZ